MVCILAGPTIPGPVHAYAARELEVSVMPFLIQVPPVVIVG